MPFLPPNEQHQSTEGFRLKASISVMLTQTFSFWLVDLLLMLPPGWAQFPTREPMGIIPASLCAGHVLFPLPAKQRQSTEDD